MKRSSSKKYIKNKIDLLPIIEKYAGLGGYAIWKLHGLAKLPSTINKKRIIHDVLLIVIREQSLTVYVIEKLKGIRKVNAPSPWAILNE